MTLGKDMGFGTDAEPGQDHLTRTSASRMDTPPNSSWLHWETETNASEDPNRSSDPSELCEPSGGNSQIDPEGQDTVITPRLSSAEDPSVRFADLELIERLQEFSHQLPPVHQKVLRLYFLEGLRLEEIAEACETSASNVTRIHAECMAMVHELMEAYSNSLE